MPADNDGHGFFEALGDSVITGPTLTNVNDFRAVLIRRKRGDDGGCAPHADADAKIVATLGPASASKDIIRSLFRPASTCFASTSAMVRTSSTASDSCTIREVERESGRPIGVLADMQGPKLRVGTFAEGPVMLSPGSRFRLDLDPTSRAT